MRGQFKGKIRIDDREVEEDIHIVEGLCRSLLSRPDIKSLKLLAHIGEVK